MSVRRFGLILLGLAVVVAFIGFLNHSNIINNWAITDFYANVTTELLSIVITILIIDKLNNDRAKKQAELQIQRQKTLDLYDEYETPGMVNVRMKTHLLLTKNNELDHPITFYEMYQTMCLSDPDSINPDTNEKNIDTWSYISTLILYFGKLGNYQRQNMLDKEFFQKFLGDFEYYYVRCLHNFFRVSILDAAARDRKSRVDLLESIVELAEWSGIDIKTSRFLITRDNDKDSTTE